jgi:hypothetical protein
MDKQQFQDIMRNHPLRNWVESLSYVQTVVYKSDAFIYFVRSYKDDCMKISDQLCITIVANNGLDGYISFSCFRESVFCHRPNNILKTQTMRFECKNLDFMLYYMQQHDKNILFLPILPIKY